MREKILVTGGTGYIGSHTVVELINAGYDVLIVDNLCNSNIDVLEGIFNITGTRPDFINVDCSDFNAFSSELNRFPEIKYAIHFAAFKAVGESVEKPLEYYRNNLYSLINLIEILKERKESGIVFSSSCTVYGQPDLSLLPLNEEAPIVPSPSPYGKSKQMCEDILKDSVHAICNLKGISLRYFNPVGAHPSSQIGELPVGAPQNLMPVITQTAAGLRKSMTVFGNDYNTPDGTCIRDYIYVCDLAKAHVKALQRFTESNLDFEAFNLGVGKGLSVLELIKIFEKHTGVNVNHIIAGRRAGDVEQLWANPAKANHLLNWKADTPIEQVVESAWNWEKKIRGIK